MIETVTDIDEADLDLTVDLKEVDEDLVQDQDRVIDGQDQEVEGWWMINEHCI